MQNTDPMKVPRRYVVTITGDVERVRARHAVACSSLQHLASHLLIGEDVPAEQFARYGLQVWVEEDTDQGEG